MGVHAEHLWHNLHVDTSHTGLLMSFITKNLNARHKARYDGRKLSTHVPTSP
jgi:hypothetical protein